MIKGTRRKIAAAAAALGMGIGGAVWAASSASAAPSAIAECTSGQLAVWVSPELGNGAAGSIFYPLEFTNTSGRTCFLIGWPGVSATNANVKQLGSAATRDSGVPNKVINVAPGATVHATLRYIDVQVDKSAGCKATTSTFLKVFPPDQRSARLAFFAVPACTVKGRIYLAISRIQKGLTGP
jgi:Protein of unknown function (DUF4232)